MMKLTDRQHQFIDAVQWILIGFLMLMCLVVFIGNRRLEKEKDFRREEMYIKIYDSHKIVELEAENLTLKDSIDILNNKLKHKK